MIDLQPSTESDVREFGSWRYEPPYDVYNITDHLEESVAYFLDPTVNCHTLLEEGIVVGFCTFGRDAQVPGGDYSLDAIDIGLGVKPALTGSGKGSRFVDHTISQAEVLFGPSSLRVTIAVGNARARRVWVKKGFIEVSRFETPRTMMGSTSFAVFVLEV